MRILQLLLIQFILCLPACTVQAQLTYPYPVKSVTITLDGLNVNMAYMDIAPNNPNGEAVLLLHGKNFTGFYWKNVIVFLANAGYRVIVPDQVGWGLSSKPDVKYSFEMLASNNRILLDSLHINRIHVIGHSMGGMLASRFALMFPERVGKLVLEDPLGLEDYKKFVPYKSIEQQYKKEQDATYASYKKYQQGYYPAWKPEYEVYVKQQAEALKQKDFSSVAYINALTYQMIYEQPVIYEINNLKMPVLLVVGQLDRTIPGKDMLKKEQVNLHGNFPQLALKAKQKLMDCKVITLPGVGHIPHIQKPALFNSVVLDFLKRSK